VKAASDPITCIANREFASNTYICPTREPGGCIVIDPGLDREAIQRTLDEAKLTPLAIFATHGHFDHIGSAELFRRKYSIPLHMHGADAKIARSSNFLLMSLKYSHRVIVPEDYIAMDEGFSWSSGNDRLEVLHTPGHTPGSTVLRWNGRAFTGDTIFIGRVWFGSLPGENRERLVASLRRLWDLLPDETSIQPGHGGAASFGQIKATNAPLRQLMGLPEAVRP
jgi:hydroxyacylglutathione hydrolase